MPIVTAGPDRYLLVGRGGRLENRGTAVRAVLLPGAIYVLVPSTKQEAAFEFTQETKDGIPLRFKGIVVYRIIDPLAAARQFDFGSGLDAGIERITALVTHVCLGELRDAVSHMTMAECIEGRKTVLSGVVDDALRTTVHDGGGDDWGIAVEVAQVAQVFIVDADLRAQLEAEVRNEIRLAAERSNLRTEEETQLAQMASADRVSELRLANDREDLRRKQERFRAEMEVEEDRVATETPVRLMRTAREREALVEEVELRRLQLDATRIDVERDLALPRAQQDLRRAILPLEQAPSIVESASKVLHGTNLSIYGEDGRLVGQLAPLLELVTRAVADATAAGRSGSEARPPAS